MDWQIGTASVYLPCHLASYSCTITLYMSCFGHLLCFPAVPKRSCFAFNAPGTETSSPLVYISLLISSILSAKKRRREHAVWGLLWANSVVMSCAYSVCIFHLQIAEQNWVCETKQTTRPLKYLRAFTSCMYEDTCLKFLQRPHPLVKLPLLCDRGMSVLLWLEQRAVHGRGVGWASRAGLPHPGPMGFIQQQRLTTALFICSAITRMSFQNFWDQRSSERSQFTGQVRG